MPCHSGTSPPSSPSARMEGGCVALDPAFYDFSHAVQGMDLGCSNCFITKGLTSERPCFLGRLATHCREQRASEAGRQAGRAQGCIGAISRSSSTSPPCDFLQLPSAVCDCFTKLLHVALCISMALRTTDICPALHVSPSARLHAYLPTYMYVLLRKKYTHPACVRVTAQDVQPSSHTRLERMYVHTYVRSIIGGGRFFVLFY